MLDASAFWGGKEKFSASHLVAGGMRQVLPEFSGFFFFFTFSLLGVGLLVLESCLHSSLLSLCGIIPSG